MKHKPHAVTPAVAQSTTVESIRGWFDRVSKEIDPLTFDKDFIFNMDETMIQTTTNHSKVYHRRDDSAVVIESNPEKSLHITLVVCVSAAGRYLDPMAIMNIQSLPASYNDILHLFHWSYQHSGWMTKDIFEKWIRLVFVPAVRDVRSKRQCEKPALLFVDGHSSRENSSAMKFLLENKIHCVLFPPHTSHVLQPLDCGVFGSFKQRYTHNKRSHLPRSLTEARHQVLKDARRALDEACSTVQIMESFETSGIYPWSPEKVVGRKNVIHSLPPELSERPSKRRRLSIQKEGGVITTAVAIEMTKCIEASDHKPKRKVGRPRKQPPPSISDDEDSEEINE